MDHEQKMDIENLSPTIHELVTNGNKSVSFEVLCTPEKSVN